VWEAGEAALAGARAAEVAVTAEAVAVTVGNVFVVRALDLARAGGRLAVAEEPTDAVPVLSLVAGELKSVGQARDLHEAAVVMADYVTRAAGELRVAIGIADHGAAPLWQALEALLEARPEVREVVRYRVGPSVGAHTGPGTAGAFFYPSSRGGLNQDRLRPTDARDRR
jgi:fatty acid-binding protein DegV